MDEKTGCLSFSPGEKYRRENRKWQGIPGIEKTSGGRLWAVWYSGGPGEGPENYVIGIKSDDEGKIWSAPCFAIDPPGYTRAFDPVLWKDPAGKLHLFWNQSEKHFLPEKGRWSIFDGRGGVWTICSGNPDDEKVSWSAPVRIAEGIVMNKPTVLSSGDWLLPAAVWNREPFVSEMESLRFSNVYISKDSGKSWKLLGRADVPERTHDEHMIVELKDGRLWMLVRTRSGIGESYSDDMGRTWTPGKLSPLGGPNSRFHIRRLKSGRLLLVHHGFENRVRSRLTASLSEDEGLSWPYMLLLDERESVSYPDATEDEEGKIYVIYDRERYKSKEILMAVVMEEDIIKGSLISNVSRVKVPVDCSE